MHDNDDQILPVHPVYCTALAVLEGVPVWPQCGAADDDDDGPEIDLEKPAGTGKAAAPKLDILDDDDEDEAEEEGTASEEEEEWKPPTKEEWAATQKALTDANAEAKNKRLALRDLKRQQTKAEAAPVAGTDAAARAEALAEAEKRLKPIAIAAEAKAALIGGGFQNPTKERLRKIIGRMDMDEIEIDDDGEVVGLEDQIDQLKEDFPELFTAPVTATTTVPPKIRPPKISTANKPPAKPEYKTTGERLAARITAGEE